MVVEQLAGRLITLMLAKFILNDVPHLMYGNPGNPSGSETSDIIARTGMKEYEYRFFPEPAEPIEERKRRVYPYTRRKVVGSFLIQMTRTDSTCAIKLYEYLAGWRQKLRATWTGIEKAECEAKFEQIVDVIKQVRLERRTQLMR